MWNFVRGRNTASSRYKFEKDSKNSLRTFAFCRGEGGVGHRVKIARNKFAKTGRIDSMKPTKLYRSRFHRYRPARCAQRTGPLSQYWFFKKKKVFQYPLSFCLFSFTFVHCINSPFFFFFRPPPSPSPSPNRPTLVPQTGACAHFSRPAIRATLLLLLSSFPHFWRTRARSQNTKFLLMARTTRNKFPDANRIHWIPFDRLGRKS